MTELDPFHTRSHVLDFDAVAADYRVASDAARATLRSVRDIAYGDGPNERLDLFFPDHRPLPAPVHLFIHGGYWRANVKEDYAFVATSIVAAGAIGVILDYALMPKVRMASLVDQVRRAATWVHQNIALHGGDPQRLSASGHSAGAHLASYLAAKAPHEHAFPAHPVPSLLLVSGLYALWPLTQSFLQAEIGLTPEEVAHWSPVDATVVPGTKVTLTVGSDETEPFHRQAEDYSIHLLAQGAKAERIVLPRLNHMSIVRDLGRVGSPLADLLGETIGMT